MRGSILAVEEAAVGGDIAMAHASRQMVSRVVCRFQRLVP